MSKLIVQFTGICAHFQRVPGLEGLPAPHRVVCVDSAAPEPIEQGPVLPHVPYLYITTPGEQGLPDPVFGSPILGGAVLSVRGAAGKVTYDRSYTECMPRLLTYYADFVPDPDVVIGNRASCYFDVQAGVLGSATMKGGERYAFLTVDLPDGEPVIIDVDPPFDRQVVVPQGQIVMLRMTTIPLGGHADADFLLEYLTGKGGISPAITDWPGKDGQDNLPCASLPAPSDHIILADDLTTPACSNSGYP
jgi:hypothetical protein